METTQVFAFIEKYAILIIPVITGLFISFIAEYLTRITPAWMSNHLFLFLLSVTTTALTMLAFPYLLSENIFLSIFMFCLNLAFAYLFYIKLGQKVVSKILDKIGDRIDKESDKIDKV